MNCPIAIVGMACRYPDSDTVEQLFVNSLAQRRSFRKIPDTRLAPGYFDTSGVGKDRAYARQAALIKGFDFDRERFRVSRSSYDVADMSHWLALSVAREAIEEIRFRKHVPHPDNDAVRVIVGNTLTGEFSRAGLMRLRWPYVRGVVARQLRHERPNLEEDERERWLRDLEVQYKKPFPPPNEEYLAGGLANTIAGRICNHFDFKGGGYTVDGACASSLLAVADACSVLASGDVDMALAGGVDLSIDPFELVGFSRTAALAHDEMLVYDEQSAGFLPGEGCGFVALMRYQDAVRQCERIHAVIRGWGISSDGRGGLTRPEAEGQILALKRCYARAGYGIETVSYFEGHGTGTKVGDATELNALIAARRDSGNPIRPAVISSIKANIGHTKAAAGLAGLLRASKCVAENILPPTTACRRPHALFDGNSDNLRPSDRPRLWKLDKVARRAGVSAMGFGGINTHVTIEETPLPARTSVAFSGSKDMPRFRTSQDTELFLFSASRREDLAWTIGHLAGFADACSLAELTDLAVEMAFRATRGALSPWKAAIVAATPSELSGKLAQLQEILTSSVDDVIHLSTAEGVFLTGGNAKGKICLIFPGQGAPARAHGGVHANRFDGVREIYHWADLDSFACRDNTDFAQPSIVTASLAGLAMLKGIGVSGDVAVGHSLGELAALHWAGCFEEESLLSMAGMRGRVMVADPNAAGAMAAIAATPERVRKMIGAEGELFVANINSSKQTVVAGDRAQVEALVGGLRKNGIAGTVLQVRQAFHTPAMAAAAGAFKGMLKDIPFYKAERKVISTVTGRHMAVETDVAAYLCRQMVEPVQFLKAASLAAEEVDLFIEVGPGGLMMNLIRDFSDKPAISLDVGGNSLAGLLHAAAAAYVIDCSPKIATLFEDRFARAFNWSWTPRFFQNPCEATPGEPEPELETQTPTTVPEARAPTEDIAADSEDSTRDRLRRIIAEHTGLPVWTLQNNSKMLSDLHLNSIAVGEIVTRLTASFHLPTPVDPVEYADASIDAIAEAVDMIRKSGGVSNADPRIAAAGLASWVRVFEMSRVQIDPPKRQYGSLPGKWEGFGAIGNDGLALLKELNSGAHGNGVIVWLSALPCDDELPALLQAAQLCIEQAGQSEDALCFVVVQFDAGASGFARSFFTENKSINTLVINAPHRSDASEAGRILREIDASPTGFKEVFLGPGGLREEPRLKLVKVTRSEGGPVIGEKDLVLVSGGGKGISAECGYQLARRTGCALLILGRSLPHESAELAANLKRLGNAGVRVRYCAADVTDAKEISAAVSSGCAEFGLPVTGLIHGAGMNSPQSVANLSASALLSTLKPKIQGLKNLLDAIDPDKLKLMANFSSIIARIGLRGEADYALANEWLSRETEVFHARRPNCRCLSMEWSVWSGAGMGQRLGRLDALAAQGISPISIDEGVREFMRLVETPGLPVSLIISGRFGAPPTIDFDRPHGRAFRFIDSIPVYYPGTELIAECNLSAKTDLYAEDHMLNDERIFPAVMALEAMTQAACVMMGRDVRTITPHFRGVAFRKAIVVPKGAEAEPLTIRLLVLAGDDDELSLAIRCSTTGFQVNHVEARCLLLNQTHIEPNGHDLNNMQAEEISPFDPARALYENVLFQTGRFRRIQGYQLIEARRCQARFSLGGTAPWFSQDLPQDCLLGDPGVRDAALHAIQACIPHKTVIPIFIKEIQCGFLEMSQAYRMSAVEIADRGDELVYDMTISGSGGRLRESWRGITLRVVGVPANLRLNSPPLMAPYIERQVAAVMPQANLRVSIIPVPGEAGQRTASTGPDHRPDGKPESSAASRFQSIAYNSAWKLMADAAMPVGCDLQSVLRKKAADWQRLLGQEGFRMTETVSGMVDEPLDMSATRVWTVREAMKKAGLAATAHFAVDPDPVGRWVVFKSGNATIFSSRIEESPGAAAACVAVALQPAGNG